MTNLKKIMNGLNNETYISIGLAILLFGFILRVELRVQEALTSLSVVKTQMAAQENIYIRKDETLLRLDEIQRAIDRIEKRIESKK